MPYYTKHKTIFIHVPKTGGQTIESILGKPNGLFGLDADYEYPHLTADEARDFLGSDSFQLMLKFAFVRNPWDRMVSGYSYSQGGLRHLRKPAASFREYVEAIDAVDLSGLRPRAAAHLLDQYAYLYDKNGTLLVDRVGRFEEFESNLQIILKEIGVPVPDVIPRLNYSSRNPDYRTFYTDDLVETVGRIYKRDVDTFNYTF